MSADLREAVAVAYRAHCEAQHHGPMEDGDFEAARSRVEEAWVSAAVAAAAPLIEAQVRAQIAHLTPGESIALTVAKAQVGRGEPVYPNVAAVCVMALARIARGDS